MDDLDLDDAVITDDEALEIPPVEMRIPAHWQNKMSTKALGNASPLSAADTLKETSELLAARVSSTAVDANAAAGSTLPSFVWDHLSGEKGSHKATEQELASLVNGIERSWQQHVGVQLFGELCGMLTADHSEVVARRVLGLLAPDLSPPLLPPAGRSMAAALSDDGSDGEVGLDAAFSVLPRPLQ